MTPREFFAVAVMLSTNYDERQLARCRGALSSARDDLGVTLWGAAVQEHEQRIGAKRALWLDVHG